MISLTIFLGTCTLTLQGGNQVSSVGCVLHNFHGKHHTFGLLIFCPLEWLCDAAWLALSVFFNFFARFKVGGTGQPNFLNEVYFIKKWKQWKIVMDQRGIRREEVMHCNVFWGLFKAHLLASGFLIWEKMIFCNCKSYSLHLCMFQRN